MSKKPLIQRILVTGGAGFIGSHTVAKLLEQELQVIVLDNLFSGSMTNLDLTHPNLEFIEGDVLEYPLVADLLTGCDAVLHLAAIASVPMSIEKPIYSFQVNTQGLLHVLEGIRHAKHPIRLVFASSAAVYGEAKILPCQDGVVISDDALSPYALQKMDNERYADLYARLFGVQSLALRYFNVYGEGQDPTSPYSGVISRFLEGYQQGEALTIFGDGQQSRDFIHVSDVAKANLLALKSEVTGAMNIATGKPETLLNLIDYIEAAGLQPVHYQLAKARTGDIKVSYGSTDLVQQALNFKATVTLKEGIYEMVTASLKQSRPI